jgi:hypothetical protein
MHADREIDALSYNIKTKVLVLRIGDIREMKIEHMQLHFFHQHWLCVINDSVS